MDANAIYDIDGVTKLANDFKYEFGLGVCVTDYSSIRTWYDEVIRIAENVLDLEIKSLQKKGRISVAQDLNGMISLRKNLERELKSRYPSRLDNELIQYTRAGFHDLVQKRLDNGAFINARENGFGGPTPLMIAASNSDLKMVKLLMQKNPDVNMQNSFGNNSIMCMAENQKPHGFNSFNSKYKNMNTIGEILLENNVDTKIKNEYNENAYELAYNNGYSDFALMILEHSKKRFVPRIFSTGSQLPFASNHPVMDF